MPLCWYCRDAAHMMIKLNAILSFIDFRPVVSVKNRPQVCVKKKRKKEGLLQTSCMDFFPNHDHYTDDDKTKHHTEFHWFPTNSFREDARTSLRPRTDRRRTGGQAESYIPLPTNFVAGGGWVYNFSP